MGRPMAKRPKLSEIVNEDRLSNLPDCVMLHILSFLITEQAVQTCVLSSRYKDLWKNLPTLILYHFRTIKIFTKFMYSVLSLRDSSIPLQSLHFSHHGSLPPSLIKRVANYAISRNVRRLVLSVSCNIEQLPPEISSMDMEIPQFLLSWLLELVNTKSLTVTASTLQVLSLNSNLLKIKLPSLGNLKSLKVKTKPLAYGFRKTLNAIKLGKIKSRKEAAKLRKSFKAGLEPTAPIPDGILDFLVQNSPSAEVEIIDCSYRKEQS